MDVCVCIILIFMSVRVCYPINIVVKVANIEPGCNEQWSEADWCQIRKDIINNRCSKLQQVGISRLAIEHLPDARRVDVGREGIHKSWRRGTAKLQHSIILNLSFFLLINYYHTFQDLCQKGKLKMTEILINDCALIPLSPTSQQLDQLYIILCMWITLRTLGGIGILT